MRLEVHIYSLALSHWRRATLSADIFAEEHEARPLRLMQSRLPCTIGP